jgi:Zn-dependent protease
LQTGPDVNNFQGTERLHAYLCMGLALMLVAGTLTALRGGLVGQNRLTIVGFDASGLALGLLAILVAGYFWGPIYGCAFVLSVMIHEFGHVAAFRVAGHADARFRLIPLIGGVAISDRLPATQMKDFFISLMGPGISVAPMALSYAAFELTYDRFPQAAVFFQAFALVTASLNFFNLLPFWPLDGGRCLRILAFRFGPKAAHGLTVLMSATLAAAALSMQSMALLFFALLGAQGIMNADTIAQVQGRLTWGQWAWALGAYLFTAGAHLAGGWYMIANFL